MSNSSRKILVTCALPYANGAIHLGHMLEHIQADIWVRFQRMRGHHVHFVCADDAHGTPIMLNADKLGITPEQLIEQAKADHIRDFQGFNISFDNYHSTHSEENREITAEIYNKLNAAGFIKTKTISQLFDPEKICSCLIVSSKALVRTAVRKINTGITARSVHQLIAQWICLIRVQRFPVQLLS